MKSELGGDRSGIENVVCEGIRNSIGRRVGRVLCRRGRRAGVRLLVLVFRLEILLTIYDSPPLDICENPSLGGV